MRNWLRVLGFDFDCFLCMDDESTCLYSFTRFTDITSQDQGYPRDSKSDLDSMQKVGLSFHATMELSHSKKKRPS